MDWPKILTHPLNKAQTMQLAREFFGDMIKIAVDVEKKAVAAGCTTHADAEALLMKHGSKQKNIWGVSYFPLNPPGRRLEYTALMNDRPRQGNPAQQIRDPDTREKIKDILGNYLEL